MSRPRRPTDEVIARAGILAIVIALAIGLTLAGRDARDARQAASANGRQLGEVTAQLGEVADAYIELRQLATRQADLLADLADDADVTPRQKSALDELAALAAKLVKRTSTTSTTTTRSTTTSAAPAVTVTAPPGAPGPAGPRGPAGSPGPAAPTPTSTPCALPVLSICLGKMTS